MQPIEIPELPKLRGKKAVNALYDIIDDLEDERGEELTDKQTDALIRIARELICAIEEEKSTTATGEPSEQNVIPSYAELTRTWIRGRIRGLTQRLT